MVAPCNPPATFPPARRNTARASTVKTAHNGRLRCQNEKGRSFPGLSFFVSERRYGVTKGYGKHEGEQRQPLYLASALMPRCRHAP